MCESQKQIMLHFDMNLLSIYFLFATDHRHVHVEEMVYLTYCFK